MNNLEKIQKESLSMVSSYNNEEESIIMTD